MLKGVYKKNNFNKLRTCADALHRVLRGGTEYYPTLTDAAHRHKIIKGLYINFLIFYVYFSFGEDLGGLYCDLIKFYFR